MKVAVWSAWRCRCGVNGGRGVECMPDGLEGFAGRSVALLKTKRSGRPSSAAHCEAAVPLRPASKSRL
jgi:hypothetical protein